MKYLLSLLVVFCLTSAAQAERYAHLNRGVSKAKATATLSCRGSVADVKFMKNVLYKNENIHGGRGRTFLDQNRQMGSVRRLSIAGTNNKIFACFGLWTCDYPFGCRYYQAMCGDRLSNSAFIKAARSNGGSSMAIVGNGKGKCMKIDTAATRYGNVRK